MTSEITKRQRWGAWVSAGVVTVLLAAALTAVHPVVGHLPNQTQLLVLSGVYVLAGASWLATLVGLHQTPSTVTLFGWIVAVGLLARLVCFAGPPAFETDYYRFMWDGAVTANGLNPYAMTPAEVLSGGVDEERLEAIRRASGTTLAKINHPKLTTIYPPVAQGLFAVAYWIAPFEVIGLRVVFLAAELGIVGLLAFLMGRLGVSRVYLVIYWWNPVAIKEFYVGAHMDALAILFALAAMAAVVAGRKWLGTVVLGFAVGIKLWPVFLAPVLLRYVGPGLQRGGPGGTVARMAVFGGVALLCTWPLVASWGSPENSGLAAYAAWWTNNAGLFGLVDSGLMRLAEYGVPGFADPVRVGRYLALGAAMVLLGVLLRPRLDSPQAVARWSAIAVGGLFLISPTQFPWYYTWALPFMAHAPGSGFVRAMLLYTVVVPLYHLQYEFPWVLWVEHVPVWVAAGYAGYRSWRRGGLGAGVAVSDGGSGTTNRPI